MAKLDKWEKTHYRNETSQMRRIDSLYDKLVQEAARLGVTITSLDDAVFTFDKYPALKKRVDALLQEYHDGMETIIVNGIKAEWTLANNKNNELSRQVFGDKIGKLTDEQYKRYFSTNSAARDAFIARKTDGLNLSDRVWKYTDQFKEEIELGLDLGIRSGQAATDMAQDLKRYLRYPDKLFRRVRDEHGNLQLSKAAKAFHPGRGVYRSSYKNARRLTATETNIAYRTADYERMQTADYIVGIKICLSNNHPETDICDELKGDYPKDFKFTGWHPHCRCHIETILKTKEEMDKDVQKILAGEPLDGESVNRIDKVPTAFQDWVKDNKDRIDLAKQRGTLPYFIKDNEKTVQGILTQNPTQKTVTAFNDVIDDLSKSSIDYLEAKQRTTPATSEDIIKDLAGGDMTVGSCSSLAFAYAGNMGGLEVLDFRGGTSLDFFSNMPNIKRLVKGAGGAIVENTNDYHSVATLLNLMTEGHEYYFATGEHAAIIRKVNGVYEYLELQSSRMEQNGFQRLTTIALKYRFGAKKSHTSYGLKLKPASVLVDIKDLQADPGFQKVLGYINTEASKQRKGIAGGRK